MDYLREEIGDIEALSDESEQAFESFALLRVEFAVEQWSYAYIVRIVVEVGVRTDPKHHCRGFAEGLRRGTELWEHFLGFLAPKL